MKPEKIKSIRIENKKTQKEFGKLLGFGSASQIRVSELENGKVPISKQVEIILKYLSKYGALS